MKYCIWCNPTILVSHWFVKFAVHYPTDLYTLRRISYPMVARRHRVTTRHGIHQTMYKTWMQQNTFHEPVACHLDISAPGPRFGLFFNYSKYTQQHQYSRYISGAALEISVSVNNDITMSPIESDSYMTVHALFQFNEAAYGLTRLVVDQMTLHDSALLYWQPKHVDCLFFCVGSCAVWLEKGRWQSIWQRQDCAHD